VWPWLYLTVVYCQITGNYLQANTAFKKSQCSIPKDFATATRLNWWKAPKMGQLNEGDKKWEV